MARKIKFRIIQRSTLVIRFIFNPNNIIGFCRPEDRCNRTSELKNPDILYKRVRLVVLGPLSSALVFQREMFGFTKHSVKGGKEPAFGRMRKYFGVMEISGRGPFHTHGFL